MDHSVPIVRHESTIHIVRIGIFRAVLVEWPVLLHVLLSRNPSTCFGEVTFIFFSLSFKAQQRNTNVGFQL